MPAQLSAENLSVQLYTVREAMAEDLPGTLERVAGFGYKLVEPYGLMNIADDLKKALPANGLSAPTTHCSLLGAELDPIFSTAKELGIETVIDPAIRDEHWGSADAIASVAEQLNAAAAKAAEYGLTVGYHNHWWELETMIDGRHGLEVLADQLEPGVRLEVDTYWAKCGGADVTALLATLGDRVLSIHIKDGDGTRDTKTQVAVGQGSLPVWDYINAVTHLTYGVVELDDSAGDRFDAIKDSFTYLTKGA